MRISFDKTLNSPLRKFKNYLIDQYYRWRIETPEDPYKILLRKNPYKILFILGHMRSGSSLFTHILNSHPDIIGFGETHLQYASEEDFKKLLYKVYWHIRDYQMQQKYVLDKVLHNSKFIQEDFLKSQNLYSIFLIREPKRTLASIMDLKPHWNEEYTLEHYVYRLSSLARYAELINSQERSLFLTHDQLINRTNEVFMKLKTFLKTETDFSEHYNVLRTTGLEGVGDKTDNIKAGYIVRNPRNLSIQISEATLNSAQEAFDKCSKVLRDYCDTIDS